MTTKMKKDLFKGLRYISQIFEEEKEQEIQIGFPTDVKHVAHIGWDGPSVESSPSWMKEFKSPTGFQSAPLVPPGDQREDTEIKWVSEDSRRSSRGANSPVPDSPELPRSSRRHHSSDNNSNDSPRKKDSSTKSRHSRRNHSKDSSEGSIKSNRQPTESSSQAEDSLSRGLPPDGAKKTRRKKSKEAVGGSGGSTGGGSTRSRSKGGQPTCSAAYASAYSDNGNDNEGSVLRYSGPQIASVQYDDQEKDMRRVVS